MRAILLGNHTVGVRALDALRDCCAVRAVVAHPPDPEDGVRYASLHAHAERVGLPAYRLAGRDPRLAELVAECAPELLLSVDYRYRVPAQVLDKPGLTSINLHPGLLPRYRGRAPLNWAILNGETELGLTAHLMAAEIDSGDIVAQERFALGDDEDVGDALRKLYPLYERVVRSVVADLGAGGLRRVPQDHARATTFPRRRPEDGRIDWREPADRVRRLVRAVADPYPGAFSDLNGGRITIWRAVLDGGAAAEPGTVTAWCGRDQFCVACGAGGLRITRWSRGENNNDHERPQVGECLQRELAGAAHG